MRCLSDKGAARTVGRVNGPTSKAGPPRTGRTRAGDLADDLRQQILTGALPAGAKLPSESELTATFEVSRSVVREALQQLQAGGLVESFQGRGTFVLDLPAPDAGDAGFQASSVDDAAALLEYRIGVESEAAALAAVRRTSIQLKAVERALDRFAAAAARPQDVVPADYDLHLRIAVASGNRFCRQALAQLGPRMIMSQRAALADGTGITDRDHFQVLCAEHEAIVGAIAAGDPMAAAAAMRLHLTSSKARLRPT